MQALFVLAALVLSLQLALAGARSPFKTAAGACNNAQDLAAFKSHNGTFRTSLEQCAVGCLGGADCSASCIRNAVGLTPACSNCFGADVACTATNCYWSCLNSASPACVQCSIKYCEAPLLACAGVPKNAIPQ